MRQLRRTRGARTSPIPYIDGFEVYPVGHSAFVDVNQYIVLAATPGQRIQGRFKFGHDKRALILEDSFSWDFWIEKIRRHYRKDKRSFSFQCILLSPGEPVPSEAPTFREKTPQRFWKYLDFLYQCDSLDDMKLSLAMRFDVEFRIDKKMKCPPDTVNPFRDPVLMVIRLLPGQFKEWVLDDLPNFKKFLLDCEKLNYYPVISTPDAAVISKEIAGMFDWCQWRDSAVPLFYEWYPYIERKVLAELPLRDVEPRGILFNKGRRVDGTFRYFYEYDWKDIRFNGMKRNIVEEDVRMYKEFLKSLPET